MSFKYRGNTETGVITCIHCGKIIQENVLASEYNQLSDGVDLCDECRSTLQVVDNFDKILSVLEFNNANEFYFVQIIQRRKDGTVSNFASNGYRMIKAYSIFSKEQFIGKINKIKELCINNNARAYIHLNRRNANELALYAIQEYAKLSREGNAYQGYRIWDRMCGTYKASGYKHQFLVDIDTKDEELLNKYCQLINNCRSQYAGDNILYILPTLNGYHVITRGFDINQFATETKNQNLPKMEVKKDSPTLLYYARP